MGYLETLDYDLTIKVKDLPHFEKIKNEFLKDFDTMERKELVRTYFGDEVLKKYLDPNDREYKLVDWIPDRIKQIKIGSRYGEEYEVIIKDAEELQKWYDSDLFVIFLATCRINGRLIFTGAESVEYYIIKENIPYGIHVDDSILKRLPL